MYISKLRLILLMFMMGVVGLASSLVGDAIFRGSFTWNDAVKLLVDLIVFTISYAIYIILRHKKNKSP